MDPHTDLARSQSLKRHLEKKETEALPKLCVISSSSNNSSNLHILDLDRAFGEDDFVLNRPVLRFEEQDLLIAAFCVVRSKLYIFTSSDIKSIFVVDLTSISPESGVVGRSELEKVGDMRHLKNYPIATLTPDGKKILVFSACLNLPFHGTAAGSVVDFELYDPCTQNWETIPGIPNESEPEDCFWTTSYTFINKSIFALQTEIGPFVLNLDFLHKGWKQWGDCDGPERSPLIQRLPLIPDTGLVFVIDDGETLLAPCGVYDIQGGNKVVSIPPAGFGSCFKVCPDRVLLPLDGESKLAITQLAQHKETGHPHLIVDIVKCQKQQLTGLMVTKSIKFLLDDVPCRHQILDLFPLSKETHAK